MPFFAAAHLFTIRTGVAADLAVQWLLTWVLLHQPPTLLLVYGDRHQFTQRRRLFVLAPLVAVVLMAYLGSVLLLTASLPVDPAAGLIAIIASHAIEYGIVVMRTLRSRYGKQTERTSLLSVLAGSTGRR